MTDQIHRDIEELFKGSGLFYDRRKGFYKDQGKPIKKIVSVNLLRKIDSHWERRHRSGKKKG
jgi:hypothetical protein